MNRLDAELQRLYLSPAAGHEPPALVAPDGRVRALVLELARPATWTALSAVWQGVQAELDMPAPAIAVSGQGGYQLWFSLAEPIEVEAALAFLEALRLRYLAGMAPESIRMEPSLHGPAPARVQHLDAIPPAQVAPERWSAFVSADLAPLFADEPWLDHPPGVDAQAELLSRLASASPEGFMRALGRLRPAPAAPARRLPAWVRPASTARPCGPPRTLPTRRASRRPSCWR